MKQLSFLALFFWATCTVPDSGPLLFVGTYTEDLGFVQGAAAGIYTCRLDTITGALTVIDTATGIVNPSFLSLSRNGKFLYAVSESGGKPGRPFGSVVAYRVTGHGKLLKINEVPSYGIAPCHLSLDATGRYVLVANYGTGNVVSYAAGADGALSDSLSMVQHSGKTPWAHMIIATPFGPQRVLAVDKGADRVFVYQLTDGKLRLADSLQLPPGAGPRHFDFHPSEKTLGFVLNENSCSLASVRFREDGLQPRVLDSLRTLPAGFHGKNTCADVHVHPNGRFVYASNRGHNSLAVFGVDPASGKLTLLGHQPTGGAVPRNFIILPGGRLLLVANQNSGNIVAFEVDANTGMLRPTGKESAVKTPVCLKMCN